MIYQKTLDESHLSYKLFQCLIFTVQYTNSTALISLLKAFMETQKAFEAERILIKLSHQHHAIHAPANAMKNYVNKNPQAIILLEQ